MAGFDLRGGRPGNYVLGRGKLYLSGDSARTTGFAAGTANTNKVWRDVGNVTGFTITQESETLEHRSSLQGLQVVDLEVPVSQKMTIAFTGDEINAVNLARFLSGTYIGADNDSSGLGIGNASAIASDNVGIAVGNRNFYVITAATDRVHDVWYDMELTLPFGKYRAISFESQALQEILVYKNPTDRNTLGPAVQLTENVDYEIDRQMGRIRFSASGGSAIAPGDDFLVIWDAPTVAKSLSGPGFDDSLFAIQPLTTSGVTVGLKFIQQNANDGDIPTEFEFWQVKLKPDGEYSGIGDDWSQLSFTGVVESVDSPALLGSSYGRVLGRDSFNT